MCFFDIKGLWTPIANPTTSTQNYLAIPNFLIQNSNMNSESSFYSCDSDDSTFTPARAPKLDHPILNRLRKSAKGYAKIEHCRKQIAKGSPKSTNNRKKQQTKTQFINQMSAEVCRESKKIYITELENETNLLEFANNETKAAKVIYLQQIHEMKERIALLQKPQPNTQLEPQLDGIADVFDNIFRDISDAAPTMVDESRVFVEDSHFCDMETEQTFPVEDSFSEYSSVFEEEFVKHSQVSPLSIFETNAEIPMFRDLGPTVFDRR